jgi:hypothetical protein
MKHSVHLEDAMIMKGFLKHLLITNWELSPNHRSTLSHFSQKNLE